MKKTYKLIAGVTATVLMTSIINKMIFMSASKKKDTTGEYYESELGDVYYKIKGNGRPLLLLHSAKLGSSHFEWEKNIDELSSRFKVYAIDLPGFGNSKRLNITYTPYHFAKFINQFITDVIKRPTAVIANENACIYALMAYRLKPEHFRKFILLSPLIMTKNQWAAAGDEKKLRYLGLPIIGTSLYNYAASRQKIKEYLLNEAFFSKEKVSCEITQKWYINAHIGGSMNRYIYSSLASHFASGSCLETLEHITLPVAIAWGENSIKSTLHIEELKKQRTDFTYCVFEQTRLLPQYENPQGFHKFALEFLL